MGKGRLRRSSDQDELRCNETLEQRLRVLTYRPEIEEAWHETVEKVWHNDHVQYAILTAKLNAWRQMSKQRIAHALSLAVKMAYCI